MSRVASLIIHRPIFAYRNINGWHFSSFNAKLYETTEKGAIRIMGDTFWLILDSPSSCDIWRHFKEFICSKNVIFHSKNRSKWENIAQKGKKSHVTLCGPPLFDGMIDLFYVPYFWESLGLKAVFTKA